MVFSGIVPRLQQKITSLPVVSRNETLKYYLEHEAGPFTIHFWAPSFKWCISIANIADLNRPAEKISMPQQTAVTATGLLWSRYSMVITPKNWNLFSVNVFMAATGLYQLTRVAKAKFADKQA
eukprot:gb/GECG01006129.1/.p1 GENE.gb/GECG01006129.1/~~gb/GECG01006129.1/.p1  ORF type:complete len:123 (+),score=7.37 gb/GECG01006129.1/:1-369(+)